MKNWILAAIFVVTWNEYILNHHYQEVQYEYGPGEIVDSTGASFTVVRKIMNPGFDYFTVEIATHSVKLATQKDVGLFINGNQDTEDIPWPKDSPGYRIHNGILTVNAFNIEVKEVEK